MSRDSKKLPSILRVSAAQLKFRPSVAENLRTILQFIAQAANARSDVALFPECALTGYNVDFDSIPRREIENGLAETASAAREHHINVILGSPTFSGPNRFNSLVVFDRRGRESFRYHKIHLTQRDAQFFKPGNSIGFFRIDRIACASIICHERRYPELVRLPVMLGAQVLFHANAGLDSLEVSKAKRKGRDGIVARAFENQIYYVFANSVGAQGHGLWSAGDSKIVSPSLEFLALANNRDETLIHASLDLAKSGRKYALDALQEPAFLRSEWKRLLTACRRRLRIKV